MCGRLNITDDPFTIDLLKYFGVDLDVFPRLPLYNMAPTEQIPIIFNSSDEYVAKFAIWWFLLKMTDSGLVPNTAVTTFNAKAQRLANSRLWKTAYKKARCIIPATSFYEYLKIKDTNLPRLIKPVDSAIAFAGLYREWHYGGETIYSCTLITTVHHPKFHHIHRKSWPVILPVESFATWLAPKNFDTDPFESLFEPRLQTDFEVVATDRKYNHPADKDPQCIEAIEKPEFISAD